MKTFALATAILACLLFSCSKDDDDDAPQTYDPTGLWIGTYTTDQVPAQGALFYSFSIRPDGNLSTEGKGGNGATYFSKGTWTLVGDSLKATYTTVNFPNVQVTQSAKFFFNKNERTLTGGTWKDGTNGSNYTGTYTLSRVN